MLKETEAAKTFLCPRKAVRDDIRHLGVVGIWKPVLGRRRRKKERRKKSIHGYQVWNKFVMESIVGIWARGRGGETETETERQNQVQTHIGLKRVFQFNVIIQNVRIFQCPPKFSTALYLHIELAPFNLLCVWILFWNAGSPPCFRFVAFIIIKSRISQYMDVRSVKLLYSYNTIG